VCYNIGQCFPGTGVQNASEGCRAIWLGSVDLGWVCSTAWQGGIAVIEEATAPEPGDLKSSFATTHWSIVLEAGQESSPKAAQALERLCRAYWYPLYAYIRRQGHGSHDAQDLAQEFFARLLESKGLRLADRSRGRFRTFLLTSLQHFLINEWHKTNREKRGRSQRFLSLDEEKAESRFASEPVVEQPPDSLYDRGWAAILLERAMAALGAEFAQSGKKDLFERLKVFVWGEKNALSYAAMGEQLGLSEGAVKVAVHRLRQRYGELLRAEIAQTVATPVEVEEELRYLVSVIRGGMTISGNLGAKTL
jgi:RNA polymerase sigma factor (sigma-70 family)